MRRSPVSALTAVLAVLAACLVGLVATPAAPASARTASAAATDAAYTWKNVRIDGGGFVPGIVFNQSEPDLIYARTDIGGAYRWQESTKSWQPLLDWVDSDRWGWTGVASIASDPVDPDNVYAAVGSYTNDWDPNNGAILRSHDRGDTWEATTLPFKLGGNMPGRGMGERLAVDPNNNKVLYFGAPSGKGLWKSTDSGVTFSQVAGFPNVGDYAQDPSDTTGYASDNQGVTWVTFDKSSGTAANGATRTFYIGVADKDNTVYRTTDGGASWQRLAGQPTGYLAHKGVLDETNGYLYLATSDTGGPYDGGKGEVWRYATATGEWTDVSPVALADAYFGYSGLSVDRQHPGTLMVTGYSSWWPDTLIWRSTDNGATWTQAWDYTSYPNRSFRYTLDASSVPWLSFGANPQPPEVTPKLGWMTESLEIDPFDSNRMMYGTGATLFGTDNLTNWDNGSKITITPMVRGLEETSVQDLISPPSGAPLVSALGDINGFVHKDLDTVPSLMFTQPNMATSTSLDYAEKQPATLVRVGNSDDAAVHRIGFSTNGGDSWWQGSSEPAGVTGGGTVAIAADASAVVWSPAGAGVHRSTDFGSSWTAASGIPAGATVEADRANPSVFYGVSGGTFYVSTNGGASFTATTASGLPASGNTRMTAVPGTAGDIWLAGGADGGTYGLWHSTDSGATFTKVNGVDAADSVGLGKAAPGQTYPALYTSAKIGGVRGIFRSDDAGATWQRINDDRHQWGWTGAAITGDPRVYGRVYVSTNGRGIQYGEPAG